jgi:hypothetical protein
MRIDGKTPIGRKVRCLDPNGQINGTVSACDTTAGWIECYVLRPADKQGNTKVLVDRKKRDFVKIRVHTDFDIVTRRGRKLFSCRWTMTKPPQLTTVQHGPLPK